MDINNRPHQWFTRIGRQTSYGGGVLGRFDGVNVGMRFAQRYTLNLVAGLPVERSTHVSPDTGRYFYGVNLLSGPWRDYWEFNGYLIEQRADAILDRRAVGGEVRYVHPSAAYIPWSITMCCTSRSTSRPPKALGRWRMKQHSASWRTIATARPSAPAMPCSANITLH